MNKLAVSMWKKESGNLLSHGKGLTEDQVVILKTLKAGDRLILWKNDKKESDSQPDYTLKTFDKEYKK